MKKSVSIITAAVCVGLSALALVGCGSPNVKFVGNSELGRTTANNTENSQIEEEPRVPDDDRIFHDGKIYEKPVIFGVRRHFKPHHSGTYGIEYVRFPQDEEKDETLDYRLTLNNDNTFELNVVSEGVAAEHYGHYYIRHGGSLTLFYDEIREPTAHNVHVCDSLYGEMLPHGKIMFFDNCNTIILAKERPTDSPDETDGDFGGFRFYEDDSNMSNDGLNFHKAR